MLLLVAAAAATTVGRAASHDGVIVIVWADQGRATNTNAGDLAVARVGDRRATPLRSWPVTFPGNGTVIGAYDARWSPERKQLALELAIWTNDPFSGLGMLDASGRTLRRLTRPSPIGRIGGWLATGTGVRWLSNERWWLVRTGSGEATRIRIAAAANPKVHSLTWSPDGRSIAGADRRGLITMNSAGRHVVRLTRGADEEPAWAPDGRTIAFVRDSGGHDQNVYTVGSNGRGLRRLTTGIVAAVSPVVTGREVDHLPPRNLRGRRRRPDVPEVGARCDGRRWWERAKARVQPARAQHPVRGLGSLASRGALASR